MMTPAFSLTLHAEFESADGSARAAASDNVDHGRRLLDRDLEPGDDAGVAASREELGIGIPSCHPCVTVLGVGDDVREAAGTDREKLDGFFSGVAERVASGPALRAEDEVARGQLLFAVLVPEERAPAQDEEHLFCSEVHVHVALRCTWVELVQRCPHPGVVRPPKGAVPCSGLFAVFFPIAGEEVLTSHAWYLQVVAVARRRPSPAGLGRLRRNTRLLAAPNRYLAAGSTIGSCTKGAPIGR